MAKQKKEKPTKRGRKTKAAVETIQPAVEQTNNTQANEVEQVENEKTIPANDGCKSVYDREDAIIGAVLKHRDGFRALYATLGINYHFKGFLQSMIWISASELRKMKISIEPSTVLYQLKDGHKTATELSVLEDLKQKAPSLEEAIEYAKSLVQK